MLLIILSMISCKSGSSPISPILPGEDRQYPSEWSQQRTQHGGGGRSDGYALLTITGPDEYLSSQLSVKRITTPRPVFSAMLQGIDDTDVSSDNFTARIGDEVVKCNYDKSTGTVTFQPMSDLRDGHNFAVLHFRNPAGSSRMLQFSFEVRTQTPSIHDIMWNDKDRVALVVFEYEIEPTELLDASRWLINDERHDVLRDRIHSTDNNLAFLPLTEQTYDLYTERSPITFSFTGKTGTVEYEMDYSYYSDRGDCECDMQQVSFELLDEHHHLESGVEKYGFAYDVVRAGCSVKLVLSDWIMTPVKHDDPRHDFYQMADGECEGEPVYVGTYERYLSSGTGTVAQIFSRKYRHQFDMNVLANSDCEGDWQSIYIRPMFLFIESFDCEPPEFEDNTPLIHYGNEAADLIEAWMEGITFQGEVPDLEDTMYCGSTVRGSDDPIPYPPGSFNFLMWELRDNPCDLFIVVKASDPIQGEDRYGNTRRGGLETRQIVLDIKYENEPYYWYEPVMIGNNMITGVIWIDHKPWGGNYGWIGMFPPEDFETLHDWPDPSYMQHENPPGFRHDFFPAETSIVWWNLSEMLRDRPDILDIRVRIVDQTMLPYIPPGYTDSEVQMFLYGNWRRSESVLDQLFDPSEPEGERSGQSRKVPLEVQFIDWNPRGKDDDLDWKIVNYYGDTCSDQTSFIYTRNSSGRAYLNLFLYLDATQDGEKVDPRKSIEVTIKSSETSLPPDMGDNSVTFDARLLTNFGFIPGGKDRLMHLFNATKDCHFYHASFTVSDSDPTSVGAGWFSPNLYVSSSDHKFGDDHEGKMDYATVVAYQNELGFTPNFGRFSFGKSRGVGHFEDSIDSSNKYWYSYDEFITSGGIEVVKVDKVHGNFEYNKPAVAVQSEASVLLVIAHGLDRADFPELEEPDYIAGLGPFSHPTYSPSPGPHWHWNAKYHMAAHCEDCQPMLYSDYGYAAQARPWLWWGDKDDKGKFWQKKSRSENEKELRWLAIVGCGTLSSKGTTPPGPPIESWKNKLRNSSETTGYLSSVCGFEVDLIQFAVDSPKYDFVMTGALYKRYGNNLEAIYSDTFEPTEEVYRFQPFWHEGKGTKDISVAAWMEAACDLVGRVRTNQGYTKMGLNTAVAIDKDNVTGEYYRWFLSRSKTYRRDLVRAYNLKINRENF